MKVAISLRLIITIICLSLILAIYLKISVSPEGILPPVAQTCPVKLVTHQDVRIDDYYWLRDIENPAVITYLEEENAYTEEMMAHTDDLREELYNEIIARLPQNIGIEPYFRNGYYYYTVYEQDKEYPLWMRTEESFETPRTALYPDNLTGH